MKDVTKRTCEVCQFPLDADNHFCGHCGAPAPQEPKEQKCSDCGAPLKAGQRFCTSCGKGVLTSIAETDYCMQCGTQLEKGVSFCAHCGTSVGESSAKGIGAAEHMLPRASQTKPQITVGEGDLLYPRPPHQQPIVSPPSVQAAAGPATAPITAQVEQASSAPFAVQSPQGEPPRQEERPSQVFSSQPQPESQRPYREDRPSQVFSTQAQPGAPAEPEQTTLEQDDSQFIFNTDTAPQQKPLPQPEGNMEALVRELSPGAPAEIVVGQDAEQAPKKKKKKGRGALIAVLVVLVLALLGLIGYLLWSLFGASLSAQWQMGRVEVPVVSSEIAEVEPDPLQDAPDVGEPSSAEPEVSETPAELSTGEYSTEVTIEPKWLEVSSFDHLGFARVVEETDGKQLMGLIDEQGRYIMEPTYEKIGEFSEDGYAVVVKDGKYGYISAMLREVVPPEYEGAGAFAQEVAPVKKNNLFGYINAQGETVIPFEYQFASSFFEGVAIVKKGDVIFFIDTKGEKKSENYEDAGAFSEGFAAVRRNGLWGYVDASFGTKVDFQYDSAGSFTNGIGVVVKKGEKFYIDHTGAVQSPVVDEITPVLGNALSLVQKDLLYGYVDGFSQEFAIEPQFIEAKGFADGLAPVSTNRGIWYYINEQKEPLLTENLQEAREFSQGFAGVKVAEEYRIINTKGNYIDDSRWEDVGDCVDGLIPVKKDGAWGYLKVTGK